MAIKSFDRQNLVGVRVSLEAALSKVGSEFGISFNLGSIRFSNNDFRVRLTGNVSVNGENPIVKEKFDSLELTSFQFGYGNGLKDTDLNEEIKLRGRNFIILGAKSRSYKNPIIVKDKHTDKQYKVPIEHVIKALGREPKRINSL